MAVYYKCKICGGEHKAPMDIGSASDFESRDISGTIIYCPPRWTAASYERNDFFWKDESN